MKSSVIIGFGEIGQSLHKIFNDCFAIDKETADFKLAKDESIYIMHICIPFTKDFLKIVKEYQERLKPDFTIIHSTCPVGTCRKLNAISSPCIGIHPHLEESLRTFTKYLGGENASAVADYFRRFGMKVYLFDNPETPELLKIMDTTHYGLEIEYFKEVKSQCEKYNVPFEAWSLWVDNYNSGYAKLGYPEYVKPNLVPIKTQIKGHCVLQNCELLDNDFTNLIKKRNEAIG
jgi:hypothetical protein